MVVVVGAAVVVVDVLGVVVVAGPCAGEPVASLTTKNTSAPSSITPSAPAATSAAGRRYHGVGGRRVVVIPAVACGLGGLGVVVGLLGMRRHDSRW